MNLILEKSKCVEWYTYLDEVFRQIPALREYWWIISDVDNNSCDPRLHADPIVIDGESLNEIIQKERVQFGWAVLSGFEGRVDQVPADLPYADGNPSFWSGTPRPQLSGAKIEIVCWDSTCTLFIGVDDSVAQKLKDIYPDIRDLDEENKKRPLGPALEP